MKLELWYPDMVRFMADASEYRDYYPRLAEKLLPYLSKDTHICDAGSGLGYLSLALAPHVRAVTAVEKHPDAASVLAENCRKLSIANVISRCGAIEAAVPREPYDAMVFCFFGQVTQILKIAQQQCRGEVFIFTRSPSSLRFPTGNHPAGMIGASEFRACLESLSIPFRQESLALEFGQPFRSLEDAGLFFRLYDQDDDITRITEDLLRGNLLQTGRQDFPFYMPHERQITFLHFSAKDIPDTFK